MPSVSGRSRPSTWQPVPRDHGGGAGVPAKPTDPERCVCQHLGRTGQRFANHQRRGRDGRAVDAESLWKCRVGQFGGGQRRPESRDQLDRRHRQRRIIDRDRGQHQPGDDDSAVKRRPVRTGPDIAGGQPSGGSGREHDLVQSRPRHFAGHGGDDDRGDHDPDRGSGDDPRLVPGRRQDLSGITQQRAVSRSRGVRDDLHLVGDAL